MKENEVLARFIGYELVDTFRSVDGSEKNLYKHPNDIYPYWGPSYPEQMGFHDRWEWLMPVWYKFKELKFDDDGKTDTHIELCHAVAYAIVYKGPLPTEACKLLSQAIEWYNANKQL